MKTKIANVRLPIRLSRGGQSRERMELLLPFVAGLRELPEKVSKDS